MANPKFQKTSDTVIIEAIFRDCKVGEQVTYEQMSTAIGRDVRKHARGAINSARKAVLSERKMVFDSIPNVGYIRLSDTNIIKSTELDRKSILKKTTKTLTELGSVDFDKLSGDDKRKHTVASAQIGAIAMLSHKTSTNKIESKVTADSKVLAIGDTLKMFTE